MTAADKALAFRRPSRHTDPTAAAVARANLRARLETERDDALRQVTGTCHLSASPDSTDLDRLIEAIVAELYRLAVQVDVAVDTANYAASLAEWSERAHRGAA
jgi:hypothetical protein